MTYNVDLFVQINAMMEIEVSKKVDMFKNEDVTREFERNKDHVIDMLILHCKKVDTTIPRVVRGKFEEDEDR